MKKKLLYVVVSLGILLVAGLVVLFLSINSVVKKGFNTAAPLLTKVDTRLGSVNLSPLSGSGTLSELFVGNPAGFKTDFAIRVGSLKLAVQPKSLFSDTIVIDELTILGPEITLEGTLNGSNLGKILANLEAAAGGSGKSSPAAPSASGEKKLVIRDVRIEGGKIHLSLTGLAGNALPVVLPPVHLQNLGTPERGLTAAQLGESLMKSLVAEVTKVAASAIPNLSKGIQDIGKNAGEAGKSAAEKASQGLKGLLNKGGK